MKAAELLLCAAVIILVLMQPTKNSGNMLTSGRDLSLFRSTKARGMTAVMEKITWVLIAAIFVLIIIQRVTA